MFNANHPRRIVDINTYWNHWRHSWKQETEDVLIDVSRFWDHYGWTDLYKIHRPNRRYWSDTNPLISCVKFTSNDLRNWTLGLFFLSFLKTVIKDEMVPITDDRIEQRGVFLSKLHNHAKCTGDRRSVTIGECTSTRESFSLISSLHNRCFRACVTDRVHTLSWKVNMTNGGPAAIPVLSMLSEAGFSFSTSLGQYTNVTGTAVSTDQARQV